MAGMLRSIYPSSKGSVSTTQHQNRVTHCLQNLQRCFNHASVESTFVYVYSNTAQPIIEPAIQKPSYLKHTWHKLDVHEPLLSRCCRFVVVSAAIYMYSLDKYMKLETWTQPFHREILSRILKLSWVGVSFVLLRDKSLKLHSYIYQQQHLHSFL